MGQCGVDGTEFGEALGLGAPRRYRDWGHATLTLRVQQACQPQVLLSRAEGSLQVVVGIGLGEFAEVHEVGPGQGHRVGRWQAGSRASGPTGESHPCLSPTQGEGQEGRDPAKEDAGPCVQLCCGREGPACQTSGRAGCARVCSAQHYVAVRRVRSAASLPGSYPSLAASGLSSGTESCSVSLCLSFLIVISKIPICKMGIIIAFASWGLCIVGDLLESA